LKSNNAIENPNHEEYITRYKSGYGCVYPDGHIIRLHQHILLYELNMETGKVLDFGCGIGQHSKYFADHGYIPFGCDISNQAINDCKLLLDTFKDNFYTTEFIPNLRKYFPYDFDLIIANQVLYYIIEQFYKMLKPGGIVCITMIGDKNSWVNYIEGKKGELCKVVLKGRLNRTAHYNFKSKQQILNEFKIFKKLHLGFYTHIIREEEGPADHYMFVGQKSD